MARRSNSFDVSSAIIRACRASLMADSTVQPHEVVHMRMRTCVVMWDMRLWSFSVRNCELQRGYWHEAVLIKPGV